MALVRAPIGLALEADILFERWNGSTYDALAKLANSKTFSMTQGTTPVTLIGRDRSNFNNTVATLTTKDDSTISFTCDMFDGLLAAYSVLGTENDQVAGSVSVSTATVLSVSGSEAYLPAHNVSNVVITGATVTTDYTVNATDGIITIVAGGALDGNPTISVDSYDYAQLVGSRIEMGTQSEIQGRLTILGTHRTNQKKFRMVLDSVKISPDGEQTYFNEDEFSEAAFTGTAEIPAGQGYFGQIWWEA